MIFAYSNSIKNCITRPCFSELYCCFCYNFTMKLPPESTLNTTENSHLTKAQLRQLLGEKEQALVEKERELVTALAHQETTFNATLKQRETYIEALEELLRLAKIQRFTASSEKLAFQIDLFDEAELETAIDELADQLPDDEPAKPPKTTRQRGFSPDLTRQRIDLCLSDVQKAGAIRTFFAKVKEELDYIPAQMVVLEYWQEKAVFPAVKDKSPILAATQPRHPLGKCQVSISVLAQIIIGKYADGLPLYRLEGIFKRYKATLNRSTMANYVIRLGDDVFKPFINLLREHQNSGDYLQGDETRIQVLKEDGKTAQAQKWMWVVRGGPPGQPVVLFEYDPTRSSEVPKRLLIDFKGIFQADGYVGYAAVCLENTIIRIGCWDHARRKFVEAVKAADTKKSLGKPTKADVALGMIRKLYRIEDKIKGRDIEEIYRVRQELSVPLLNELKAWMETNVSKIMKDSLTRTAINYCLNQWEYLIGYCQRGDLQISNVLAENAIRPFAVGRKAWLFADTPRASATCYSLIETAKANGLEPYAYIRYLLEHIAEADTVEKWEALLPWNVPLAKMKNNKPSLAKGS